jgi:hypothetical protein
MSRTIGILVAALAVVIALFFLFAPYYSTQLWWFFRLNWFWFVPIVLVVLAGLAAAWAFDERNGLGGPLALVTVAGVLACAAWFFAYNYVQASYYADTVQVTEDPLPTQAVRPPFTVSQAQVRSNLGDVPGDTQTTMYVPEDSTFSTLVERRGMFTGYQTLLEQKATTTGRLDPARCDFAPQADRRLDGVLSHSLERAINTEQRWVNWSYDDAYGWCDPQGTPYVVVPLVEQDGFWVVTEKPAGVALYNGKSGELTISPDGRTPDGRVIPGPTYPLSLAAEQRASTEAMGSYFDYVFGRVGWELPDEADAINSSASSEFVLGGADGPNFVTPLSGRGSATAISAISSVDAHNTGALNKVVIHKLGTQAHPVWQSPTAITDNLRATFGDVFVTNPGAELSELAPTTSDTFVATLGRPQNIVYRITGRGDLSQPMCLVGLDGATIRCGGTGQSGVATSQLGGAQPAPAAANSDLAKLTPEQLADLSRRANEELLRQLKAGG